MTARNLDSAIAIEALRLAESLGRISLPKGMLGGDLADRNYELFHMGSRNLYTEEIDGQSVENYRYKGAYNRSWWETKVHWNPHGEPRFGYNLGEDNPQRILFTERNTFYHPQDPNASPKPTWEELLVIVRWFWVRLEAESGHLPGRIYGEVLAARDRALANIDPTMGGDAIVRRSILVEIARNQIRSESEALLIAFVDPTGGLPETASDVEILSAREAAQVRIEDFLVHENLDGRLAAGVDRLEGDGEE